MRIFPLPDLGEGLREAEVLEWHVAVGDTVAIDQPLVSVETEKAVVEIPAPWAGRIAQLFAAPHAIVQVGAPLVGYEGQTEDAGTVVGSIAPSTGPGAPVTSSDAPPRTAPPPRASAAPAVRARAARLGVDLGTVRGSGPDGAITSADVDTAARAGRVEAQPLHGPRRVMAGVMQRVHAGVVQSTVMDDADVTHWSQATDVTVRLIVALVSACREVPLLNAWYDAEGGRVRIAGQIDLGVAVDSPAGLFVPVIRDAATLDPAGLRHHLDTLRGDVRDRTLTPEHLRNPTITLTNFGTMAGKYATPVVVPPTVGILGAGRMHEVLALVEDRPQARRMLPLSLSFDHRVVTGGEAARFLKSVIESIEAA